MRRLPLAAAVAALALTGCVTQSAEPRIRDTLIGYGVAPRQASCMADDLTRRLTLGQMRTLQRVAHEAKHDRYKDASVRDFVKLADRAGDPDLVMKVTRATFGCAILG